MPETVSDALIEGVTDTELQLLIEPLPDEEVVELAKPVSLDDEEMDTVTVADPDADGDEDME